jgi:hypothetical protein
MNTGTPESNYGYWFPGPQNDGATGWAVTPEKYGPMWIRKDNPRGAWPYDGEIELGYAGGLRMAATVIADDPLFGPIAYGGVLARSADQWAVVPEDGLRRRVHLVTRDQRLRLSCDWDGFVAGEPVRIQDDLSRISCVLENRSVLSHTLTLSLVGLTDGVYRVSGAGGPGLFQAQAGRLDLPVELGKGGAQAVLIERQTTG